MPYSIEQTDQQLLNTTAAIRYRLSFSQAAQHILHVTMEVDTESDDMVMTMPNWIPGSYKVRDFIAYQGDLTATDEQGAKLEIEWVAKNRLRIVTGGATLVRVSYTYFGNERSVRQTHVNRFHAFINPANCLMYVEGRTGEIHHLSIDHPWQEVSTSLSPVQDGILGALNYDILADSPIEIGDHFVTEYVRHGSRHQVAITGTGDFDPVWIAQQTERIIDVAVEMWGSLPYDRYLFIIQLLPGQFGGLEHSRSSVNMSDSEAFSDHAKVLKLLSLLCHEYFHLWNVKRIRPRELGPFDYNTENYTKMLWLAEGVTSYYDDLTAYRAGFYSRDEYLKTLSDDHLSKLLEVPGRSAMSVIDSSYLSWVKLYMPTPDSSNRFPSYYLKGGIIFLLVDLLIISESDGACSLDDGMRALMERYHRNPALGVTEEEFVDIVNTATGVEVGVMLRGWLASTDELPVAEMLVRLGLTWREKKPSGAGKFGDGLDAHPGTVNERWLGMQVEEIKSGLKVAKVWRDTPAEAAGLGADDELIAIDGVRVASSKQFEAFLRSARHRESIELTAASEGQLYKTTVHFTPRSIYELVVDEDASEQQKRLLDRWLKK